MRQLEQRLTLIGFGLIEARVYVMLLKMGDAKVADLSKSTKIGRTQLYPLLERMVKAGFVEKIRGRLVRYVAVDQSSVLNQRADDLRKQLVLVSELKKEFKLFLKG